MCAATKNQEAPADVWFNIRLPREMHERLVELAERNDRTRAAEVRLALRAHLEAAVA